MEHVEKGICILHMGQKISPILDNKTGIFSPIVLHF